MYQNRYNAMHKPFAGKLSVHFYAQEGGSEPVREWLLRLPKLDRSIIGRDIKTVQYGWPLGMPLVRKISGGFWEIRSSINDGIARVFFTVVGTEIVLLHAIIKKGQRTPKDDLELAQRRLKKVKRYE
jgi:phage-related protein